MKELAVNSIRLIPDLWMCGFKNVVGCLLQYFMVLAVFTVAVTETTHLLAVDYCGYSLGYSLRLSLPLSSWPWQWGLFKFYEQPFLSENAHGHHQVINIWLMDILIYQNYILQYSKPGQEGLSSALLLSQVFISFAVTERECAAASSMETQSWSNWFLDVYMFYTG